MALADGNFRDGAVSVSFLRVGVFGRGGNWGPRYKICIPKHKEACRDDISPAIPFSHIVSEIAPDC